jgi:hypothetical protein
MLTGWKAIANHMGVSVGTAKKWYKLKGLPVCRGPNNVPISFEELIMDWAMNYNAHRKCKIHDVKEQAIKSQPVPPQLRQRKKEEK